MLLKLALACNRDMARAVAALAETQGKRLPPVIDVENHGTRNQQAQALRAAATALLADVGAEDDK